MKMFNPLTMMGNTFIVVLNLRWLLICNCCATLSLVLSFFISQFDVYFISFLQKYSGHKLQEVDKVNVLDPYDSTPMSIGRIHSLSLIHGFNLNGTRDANFNIIKVTRDILLPYDGKIEGSFLLKEKEGSFTRWPLKYLQKIT